MNNVNLHGLVADIVDQQLLLTHTAFVGRVAAVEGARANVQPLTYAKDVHGAAYMQPLVVGAPRLRGLAPHVGDVVLCVVCERDISHAVRGQVSMPAVRHHDLSDTVIVGIIETETKQKAATGARVQGEPPAPGTGVIEV